MYHKRLNGYASMGYKAKGGEALDAPLDIIFSKDNFLPVFNQDIVAAEKEIVIVSPFVRKRRTHQMVQQLKISTGKNLRVIVVTRPKIDEEYRTGHNLKKYSQVYEPVDGIRLSFILESKHSDPEGQGFYVRLK